LLQNSASHQHIPCEIFGRPWHWNNISSECLRIF
jgi:hypothetical protein